MRSLTGQSARRFRWMTCAAACALSACVGSAVYLPKYAPRLVEQERGMSREISVRANDVARISAGLHDPVAAVYAVPGRADRNLVVVGRPGDDLHFVLVARSGDGVVEVGRSRGMDDSQWLEPVFFADGDCHFVLADVGSEESWGMEAFRLCPDSLRALGMIGAAAVARGAGGSSAESPLPFARMRLDHGNPVVELDTDVIEWNDTDGDSTMEPRERRRSAGRPISFEWNGSAFVPRP